MALALGEDRDQDVRAGHLLAPRRLHVDHGALDDALEAGRGLGILGAFRHQVVEFRLDVGREIALELLEIDVAGAHDGGRVLVVDQGEQQMLERRIFVVPLIGERERPVKRLFEAARECWHSVSHVLVCSPSPHSHVRILMP